MNPHRYCSGCGHIQISKIVENELIENKGVLVGSVGCSVALPELFEVVDAVSSAHGRALSVSTSLKMSLPNTPILVYAGDGDCCTIGAGELLHTILRNTKIVCVLINNQQFGMTGHQQSAMTPIGVKTKTSVKGRDESIHGIPLDVKHLTKLNPKVRYHLSNSVNKEGITLFKTQLKEALAYDGFSILEVISPCPTFWGNVKKSYEFALQQYNEKLWANASCKCNHNIKSKEYWEI